VSKLTLNETERSISNLTDVRSVLTRMYLEGLWVITSFILELDSTKLAGSSKQGGEEEARSLCKRILTLLLTNEIYSS